MTPKLSIELGLIKGEAFGELAILVLGSVVIVSIVTWFLASSAKRFNKKKP